VMRRENSAGAEKESFIHSLYSWRLSVNEEAGLTTIWFARILLRVP
jgi:hypothetical protein